MTPPPKRKKAKPIIRWMWKGKEGWGTKDFNTSICCYEPKQDFAHGRYVRVLIQEVK